MKRIIVIMVLAVSLAAGSFAGGTWWAHRSGAAHASAHAATVYTCPMHPDYHSDHPGTCPVCGMDLEADRTGRATGRQRRGRRAAARFGAGKSRAAAGDRRPGRRRRRSAGTRLLRTTGRVVADENRTYPIVAAVNGWIRNVENVTAGDTVKKDQVLASLFAPDAQFETAQQWYYSGLEMLYRVATTQPQSPSHDPERALREIESLADGLRSLGVSNSQVRELAKRRELVHDIRVESPVDGVVLKRGVTPGLRFDRGFEFYRIADLNRVWILADVSGHQLPFIRRGAAARITTAQESHALSATVSPSEPIFDETTQTLKMRLEAANPRFALKTRHVRRLWSSQLPPPRPSSCPRMRSSTPGCARPCS